MNDEKYYDRKLKKAGYQAVRKVTAIIIVFIISEVFLCSVFRHILNQASYETFQNDNKSFMNELDERLRYSFNTKEDELECIKNIIENKDSRITCFAVFEKGKEIARTPLDNSNKDIYIHLENTIRRYKKNDFRIFENYYGILRGNSFAIGEIYRTGNAEYYIVAVGYKNVYALDTETPCAYIAHVMYICMSTLAVLFIIILGIEISKLSKWKKSIMEERDRNALFLAIAHDMKGPLSAINGYAENLLQLSNDVEEKHYIKSIINNADYMNGMLNQFATYAKSEGYNRRKEEINIKEELNGIIKLYENQLDDKNLRVSVNGELTIDADKTDIIHLLDNILTNAIKYSKQDSDIVFELEKNIIKCTNEIGQSENISVEDIWKPLYRADKSRTGRKGSGLGLSIIKRILDANKWKADIAIDNNIFQITIFV